MEWSGLFKVFYSRCHAVCLVHYPKIVFHIAACAMILMVNDDINKMLDAITDAAVTVTQWLTKRKLLTLSPVMHLSWRCHFTIIVTTSVPCISWSRQSLMSFVDDDAHYSPADTLQRRDTGEDNTQALNFKRNENPPFRTLYSVHLKHLSFIFMTLNINNCYCSVELTQVKL